MRIFLAGGESRHWIYENLYGGLHELRQHEHGNEGKDNSCNCSLRGSLHSGVGGHDPIVRTHKPYILESFYYADSDTVRLLPYFGDFLLDSGAFTFMQNNGKKVDWEEYVERYGDFVKKNNIKKYFELDIDSVVGYEQVKKYRARLERITGTQPIPVWHTNRGTKEFERMSAEYPYVAIGGLVGTGKSEYARKYWNAFPWFIQTAHKNGAKIHALGFTSLEGIRKYHFDSVDSTAWTTGNRFGFIFKYQNGNICKVEPPKGHKLNDTKKVALHNFTEWVKFQRWAETHL